MGIDLYDVLDVAKDATEDEIKVAYRNKAKEHHPDKEGGDNKKMTEVTRAYGVLKDEKKRDRYDKTGLEDDMGFDIKFGELVQFAFMKIIEENDVERVNLVKELGVYITFVIGENKKSKLGIEQKRIKFQKVRDRLSSSGVNSIGGVIDLNLRDIKKQVGELDSYLEFLGEALEVVNHHDYRFEVADEIVYTYTGGGFTANYQ